MLDQGCGDLLARRNRHDVARLQLGVMPDAGDPPHSDRAKAQQILRFFARQPERQRQQIRQQLASRRDVKLMVTPGHCEKLLAY